MERLSIQSLHDLKPLPQISTDASNGLYAVHSTDGCSLTAEDNTIQYKVWFTTPALDHDIIERISGLRLYAECHDQGWADNESGGNWTWLELAILENYDDNSPRVKDGVTLAWTSQYNRFLQSDFDWSAGLVFGEQHELLGQLETGNVIAVRLCARFPAWEITTRKGYLAVELKDKTQHKVVDYKPHVESITKIQTIIESVNSIITPAFQPEFGPEILVANSFSEADERPLRVLSLDGGGVRGIASLYVLKEVMNKLTDGKQDVRPCDVFDMIAGTSSGGLIAIMLGRLGMTVDECIKKYTDFSREVFKSSWLGKKGDFATKGSYYPAERIEKIVKDCVEEKTGNREEVLLRGDHKCKVFVMAVREDAANNRGPIFLRSYKNPKKLSLLPDCKIWEAGRATSAAPVYFKPIQVGNYTLVDGGLSANNPIGWLWNECIDVFGSGRSNACFLSIGTGIPQNRHVGEAGLFSQAELAEGLASAATNSQLSHLLFSVILDAYAPKPGARKYWRFSTNHELKDRDDYEDVGELDEADKMDHLVKMTKDYMDSTLVKEDVSSCANALK